MRREVKVYWGAEEAKSDIIRMMDDGYDVTHMSSCGDKMVVIFENKYR